MTETTDWASAFAILTAGLILGAVFVYFAARRRAAAPAADMELRDLEAKRDALLEQLRSEVEAEERTRLELEAAQVLRAIDQKKTRSVPSAPAPPPIAEPERASTRRATLIGFAWGAGSVLALGGLGYFVMRSSEPRPPEAGQTMQRSEQPDPVVAQLEEAVRRSPDDLGARISLAQAYLERDHLMGVFEQTQYVLAKSPQDSRALTYQALVRVAMGQQAEAVKMLQRATESDPMLLDAWVGLAWVYMQEGKTKEAEAAMQEAMRRRPDEKERLQQVLAQMRAHRDVDPGGAQRGGAGALPPDHPPIGPRDEKGVRITLDLDPSARGRSGVVYVLARPAGVAAGPPIAVRRLDVRSLPITFDLGSSDSMLGQPLPDRMRIDARLDADGDAATRSPNEPAAARDGVPAGSAITLSLK